LSSNKYISEQKHKLDSNLLDTILALNDKEFCDLADMRLNQLISKNKMKELGIDEKNSEYWTIECLVDETFLQIARIKETVRHNEKSLTIHKYYNQAFRLLNWIPIAQPTPEFIINICDLTPRILAELKGLKKDTYNYVLKQAAGRIFENINSKQYHVGIARKLKVRLDA
jgi:hypothetical protein